MWDLAFGLARLNQTVHLFGVSGSRCPPNGYLHYVPRFKIEEFWLGEQIPVLRYRYVLEEMDILHSFQHSGYVHNFIHDYGKGNSIHTPWGTLLPPMVIKRNIVAWSEFHRQCLIQQGCPETAKYVLGGCDTEFYTPSNNPTLDYFLWFGRFHPVKRAELVVRLARGTPNEKFVFSGSVEESPDHKYYFEQFYSKMIKDTPNAEYRPMPMDPKHHLMKRNLYQNAKALILPYAGEAFGLICVEALSCGTPVIGSDEGSLREIIGEGETGFLCKTLDDFKKAMKKVDCINRKNCRSDAEMRFSRERGAKDYLSIYNSVMMGDRF